MGQLPIPADVTVGYVKLHQEAMIDTHKRKHE